MDDIRLVVIADDKAKREQIVSYLPEYIKCKSVLLRSGAKEALGPDSDGDLPNIVILDAECDTNQGLYLFDLIRRGEIDKRIKNMPVILLTKDQYSDTAMDYLEVGDAFFYEGEIKEDAIYSVVMQALNEGETIEDEDGDALLEYYLKEDKNLEKVIGATLAAPLNDGNPMLRSAVLDMDSKLAGIEAVLEHNRDKVSGNAKPLRVTNKIREDLGLPRVSENEDIRSAPRVSKTDISYIDKKAQNDEVIARSNAVRERIRRQKDLSANTATGSGAQSDNKMLEQMRRKILSNAEDALKAQMGSRNLATIVIVDDEPNIISDVESFLRGKYRVVGFSSGMKAIDYFVRDKADLILLDASMSNLSGVQTLNSIRWQPNGRSVPAIFTIDEKFTGNTDQLATNGVAGVMKKPISATALLSVIESTLKRR